MKKILIFLLSAVPLFSLDYQISVSLDIAKKTVKGTERIVWKNEQGAATQIIPFHLYMNAFAGTDTIFMRESGGRHRNFGLKQDDLSAFGYCRVLNVRVNGRDRMPSFHYLSSAKNPEKYGVYWPDEVSGSTPPDDTIAVLELDEAVEPGMEVILEIEFVTKFPRIFARSGYHGNFFMGGQWFPKIAVFEGEKGWNCHFYHASSEFFADFADFTVKIDTPADFVVGATGVMAEEKQSGDRKISRFEAKRVHDFAFTAWDRFQVAEDTWKHVKLRLLYQPGNQSTVSRQFRALKSGLNVCEYLTGAVFPYPHFTLVDVPFRAAGAGGMEYPMLVTGMSFLPIIPRSFWIADMVITHEFIHNYFYGILATNEFENAWMDEGMTSYATALAMERDYKDVVQGTFLFRSSYDSEEIGNSLYRGIEYPAKAAWQFRNGYSILSYNKPAVYFKTLENLAGISKIRQIFHTYFQRFQYLHPRPEDFFAIVHEVAGDKLGDFFETAMRTDSKMDYAVFRISSEDLSKQERVFYDPAQAEMRRLVPSEKGKSDGRKNTTQYQNTIVAGHLGDVAYPVKIRAYLENQKRIDLRWDGRGEWKRFVFVSDSRMQAAEIDPEHIFVCDTHPENNVKSLKPRTSGIFKKMGSVLALAAETLFSFYSLLF